MTHGLKALFYWILNITFEWKKTLIFSQFFFPICESIAYDFSWKLAWYIWSGLQQFIHIFLVTFIKNQLLIKELSNPVPRSKDLSFPMKYAQSFITHCIACFWKQHWSSWRDLQYNAIWFFATLVAAFLFGTIFWNKFDKL